MAETNDGVGGMNRVVDGTLRTALEIRGREAEAALSSATPAAEAEAASGARGAQPQPQGRGTL